MRTPILCGPLVRGVRKTVGAALPCMFLVFLFPARPHTTAVAANPSPAVQNSCGWCVVEPGYCLPLAINCRTAAHLLEKKLSPFVNKPLLADCFKKLQSTEEFFFNLPIRGMVVVLCFKDRFGSFYASPHRFSRELYQLQMQFLCGMLNLTVFDLFVWRFALQKKDKTKTS